MSSDATEQAIEVIRRSEADYKAKSLEADQLRQKLAAAQLELEKHKTLLKKAENSASVLREDATKKQHSLDILLKELTSKKQLIEQLTLENKRLKREVDSTVRYTAEMHTTLRHKESVAGDLARDHDSPSSLYMSYCFAAGSDPHIGILRSLHNNTVIDFAKEPANYQQLNALCDVFRMRSSVNTSGWRDFTRLSVAVEAQEGFHLVAELVRLIPTLTSVSFVGIEDTMAATIASALAEADNVSELELPQLRVTDVGFQQLMRVVNNREILASKGSGKLMIVRDLDVSGADISDTNSFGVIRGQCINTLNLSGCRTMQDKHLGEILRSTPALTKLDVAYCTGLTQDTTLFLNAAHNVAEVNLLGCHGVTSLKLNHVRVLHTDLHAVSYFECPALERIVTPITNFQVVTWATPKLEELTLQRMSLTGREFDMIANSSNLTHLSLVSCRVQSLDTLLRKMRKLIKLSLHSCSGVTDGDINSLCSTIEVLDLTDNYCLTDRAMFKISDFCRNLSHLTLKRCANVTDAGVMSLEKCQQLNYLNVLGCKRTSVVALQRLITVIPSLEHVVHETLSATAVRIDREDDEETQRLSLKQEERSIVAQQGLLGLSYVAASPARSPKKPSGTTPAKLNPRAVGSATSPASDATIAAADSPTASGPVDMQQTPERPAQADASVPPHDGAVPMGEVTSL